MSVCPCCSGTGQIPNELASADQVEQLRQACRLAGHAITFDDRVREDVAAEFLGIMPKTLRNRRYAEGDVPHVMRRGRALYALSDLAGLLK